MAARWRRRRTHVASVREGEDARTAEVRSAVPSMRDLIIALGLAPSGPRVRGAVDTTGGAGGGAVSQGPSSFRAFVAVAVCRTRWCLGGEGRRRRPDYRSGRSGGRVRGPLGACSVGVGRRECVWRAGGCCARRVFCLGWGEVGASADGRARSCTVFVPRDAACRSTGCTVGEIARD